jgi:sigma-B regulation protein RsbU (phosphoserine phosphatase)
MLDKNTHEHIIDGESASFEDHLQMVAEIAQEFATSLDIDETLNTTLHQIMDHLQGEAASIFLLDNDDTELVCRASAGPITITGLRLASDQGIVGKSVNSNQVQMVRDVHKDPNFAVSVDEKTGFTTRSILCAPLAVKGKKLGAIELINKKHGDGLFDESDQLLLTALASSAALAINNASMAAALVEQERIQMELELAREIQGNLLPDGSSGCFPVHGYNRPIREVSGDFFDHFELADGRICFNLADVSGKGMNAAMLMAKTSSLFHCLGKTITSPAELIAHINNEIVENNTRGMFVTMVGGIYDPSSDTVILANAGHHPPLLRSSDGRYQHIQESSIPIGILADSTYSNVELSLNGGCLYLYTDGLSEITAADGAQLDTEGVQHIIDKMSNVPAEKRLQSIVDYAVKDDCTVHDDITLLMIEKTC